MAGLDMHRAFRVDLSELVTQSVVIEFLRQQQIEKAAVYYEVAQQTKKPHLQGWLAFSGEAELQAFSRKWTVFKRSHKLDKSKSSVAKFRKGDTAMVYAAKDGNIVWQHGVTDDELKAIAERSYQKGETKKETFMNAIVKRVQDKGCKTDTQVYIELCEYYYENGKELSPWRLTAQCNTVCRKLWGEKFSQYMAHRERRYFEADGPSDGSEHAPRAAPCEEAVSEEEASCSSEAGPEQHDDVQANGPAGDIRDDCGSRMVGEQLVIQSESTSGRVGVYEPVRQLQDQRSQADVHAVLGLSGRNTERSSLRDAAQGVHIDRSKRVRRRGDRH